MGAIWPYFNHLAWSTFKAYYEVDLKNKFVCIYGETLKLALGLNQISNHLVIRTITFQAQCYLYLETIF